MNAEADAVKTGTSTVGITFDGGVVVGADHRATMGHFIANKSVKKLFKISNNVALTTAGLGRTCPITFPNTCSRIETVRAEAQRTNDGRGAATLTANISSR